MKIFQLILISFLLSSCAILNKTNIKSGIKKQTRHNNKISINTSNLFYYKEAFDNGEDDDRVDINYTNIEDGFFDSIFNYNNQQNVIDESRCKEGDEQCLKEEQEFLESEDNKEEINDEEKKNIQENKDNILNYNLHKYKLNMEVLKEKLKVKERNRDICRVNEKLTVTPRLKIITNKKRTYTIDFFYFF